MEGEFELKYETGPHVRRGLTEAELLDVAGGAASPPRRDMGTGWRWYMLPEWQDAVAHCRVELGFHDGLLTLVSLLLRLEDDGADTWADWSQERELERVRRTEAWLQSRGVPSGAYAWGTVWTGLDAVGGSGSGAVRFAP